MLDIQQPTPPIPIGRRKPRLYLPVTHTFPRLPTQDDLPSEDNVPMETEPHRLQMELLIDTLRPWLASHGGGYVSGNMFVYFSETQLRGEDFLGPDVFIVLGASNQLRKSWVVWQEGKGPDIVIELLSEKTAKQDKGKKKQIYQNQLMVGEYFWFDPWDTKDWAGFELVNGKYHEIAVDAQSRLLSTALGLALVRWQGVHKGKERTWLRWATLDGKLLPTEAELANTAEQRANAECIARQAAEQLAEAEHVARLAETLARHEAEQRATAAEAEIARLKALLGLKSE